MPVADVRASQGMPVFCAFCADPNPAVEAADAGRACRTAPLLASHWFASLHPMRDRQQEGSPPNCRH